MSYNVLTHSHWGLGQFFGGGWRGVIEIPGGLVKKRQSPDSRSPEVGISGDAMLELIRMSSNMEDGNQEKHLLPSFATKK